MPFKTIQSVALVLAASGIGSAATLIVDNLGPITGGTESLLLLDRAGNGLTSGFVGLYSFPGGAVGGGTGSVVALLDPTQAVELAVQPLSFGTVPAPGGFASAFSAANDGSLTGVNLFLVVGTGGTDLGSATHIGVIDTGLAFDKADIPPPPDTLIYAIESGSTIVIGEYVPSATVDWSALSQPVYTAPGLRLVLIPEPSTVLLSVLGWLGLLWLRVRGR